MAKRTAAFNPNKAWGTPGYGYAPGFFAPIKPRLPKGLALDPNVPGNVNSLAGVLQDPGVLGQTAGDFRPPPTTYRGNPLIQPAGIDTSGGGGGGGGGGAGSTAQKPGYMSELTSDPLYISALGRYNTMMQQGRDTLRNQIRNAVISSGYTPDFSSPQNADLAGYADDLDAATRTAAQGNQVSQKAQLERGYQQGLTDLDYRLGSLGTGSMVHGGANVIGTGLLKDQRDLAANQQMGALIDAIRGGIGGYHTQEQSLWGEFTGARESVASRLASLQGPTYDPTTTTGTEDTTAAPSAEPADVTTAAGGAPVAWGGRNFTTQTALAQYLNAIRAKNPRNAITVAQFRQQHPQAWKRLAV